MTLNPRIILAIAAVALFALVVFAGPAACRRWQSERAQARLDHAQGEAFQNSATDAVTAQGAANKRETDSEALTRSNERTIRDAQGSTDAVNSAVRDAGFASLCKRPSFRDSPSGRVRCHIAARVEESR